VGVKEQMIAVLRSDETARINFTFNGGSTSAMSLGTRITLNAGAFRQVAAALANDRLHVVEDHFSESRMVYSSRTDTANGFAANTFYLGNTPRSSRDFNGLVVHESVHAFFDITRFTVKWVDNEAAAYMAQAYYLRNSGFPGSRLPLGSPIRLGQMAIGDIRSGGDATVLIDAIRDSLRSNPDYESYIGGTFVGNG